MTDVLTEFLLARIAEDAAVARAADQHGPIWQDGGPGAIEDARTVVASDGALRGSGRGVAEVERHALPHVLTWAPARVLAECASKRRIVELADDPGWDLPTEVLRLLAQPYADHHEYHEEWKP